MWFGELKGPHQTFTQSQFSFYGSVVPVPIWAHSKWNLSPHVIYRTGFYWFKRSITKVWHNNQHPSLDSLNMKMKTTWIQLILTGMFQMVFRYEQPILSTSCIYPAHLVLTHLHSFITWTHCLNYQGTIKRDSIPECDWVPADACLIWAFWSLLKYDRDQMKSSEYGSHFGLTNWYWCWQHLNIPIQPSWIRRFPHFQHILSKHVST